MKEKVPHSLNSGLPHLRVRLVTSVQRRRLEGQKVVNSPKDFRDALAKDENVTLIHLHATSQVLYEALGPDGSGLLFKTGNSSHHNNYWEYEVAKCVAKSLRKTKLGLAKHFTDDVDSFDPANPDPLEKFKVPASPGALRPPDGS